MASLIDSFNPNYQHCKKCSGDYPAACFNVDSRLTSKTTRRRIVCSMCEQTTGDEKKRENRWIVKARGTIRRHAAKYIKLGYASSIEDFSSKFGWKIEKIAHDLQHAYDNQCRCGESYKDMGNGFRDVTLDITDPRQPPYYTNTGPLCSTCNTKKHKTPPAEWGARMVGWDLWKQNQEKIKNGLMASPQLFECAGLKLPIQLKP